MGDFCRSAATISNYLGNGIVRHDFAKNDDRYANTEAVEAAAQKCRDELNAEIVQAGGDGKSLYGAFVNPDSKGAVAVRLVPRCIFGKAEIKYANLELSFWRGLAENFVCYDALAGIQPGSSLGLSTLGNSWIITQK